MYRAGIRKIGSTLADISPPLKYACRASAGKLKCQQNGGRRSVSTRWQAVSKRLQAKILSAGQARLTEHDFRIKLSLITSLK
jgi:hypothetical protein